MPARQFRQAHRRGGTQDVKEVRRAQAVLAVHHKGAGNLDERPRAHGRQRLAHGHRLGKGEKDGGHQAAGGFVRVDEEGAPPPLGHARQDGARQVSRGRPGCRRPRRAPSRRGCGPGRAVQPRRARRPRRRPSPRGCRRRPRRQRWQQRALHLGVQLLEDVRAVGGRSVSRGLGGLDVASSRSARTWRRASSAMALSSMLLLVPTLDASPAGNARAF